jgi:hypothetical protein
MKTFALFAAICFVYCSGNPLTNSLQPLAVEQQLRSALCQLENGDGPGAQAAIEKVLAAEPGNIFAKRLLPGAFAVIIKNEDRSAENAARIKKAAEAYRAFSIDQSVSVDERDDADSYIVNLLNNLPEDEAVAEFSKAAQDTARSPRSRGSFYVPLAAKQLSCANDIMSTDKKPTPEQIGKAKACVAKGMEYANRGIELAPGNDSAWNYKAWLLDSAISIAKAEKAAANVGSLQKELAAAKAKSKELTDARWRALEERDKKELAVKRVEASPKISDNGIEELVEYTEEKPLEMVIPKLYFPLGLSLIAPPKLEDGTDPPKEVPPWEQKREWKPFSPNGEITLDLPDNAGPSGASTFDAGGNGASYLLIAPLRASVQTAVKDDVSLNILAWSTVDGIKGFFLRDDKTTKFEAKLLNKENMGGRPARTYALKSTSCAKTRDGTLVLIIGNERNYSITIFGAGRDDPSVQRVLKSIRFTS